MLVKIGDVARHLGVSVQAIRDWTAKGKLKCTTTVGGTRLYNIDDLYTNLSNRGDSEPKERRIVFYCRVSSIRQNDDLERQATSAENICPEAEIIKEIGSGLNWKRKKFRELFKRATQGELSEIKVFHKDRFCRFGFEIFEHIFDLFGVRISVVDNDIVKTREQEFAEDLLAITHHFSYAMYGRRKYEIDEAQDIPPRQNSTKELDENDGTCEIDL